LLFLICGIFNLFDHGYEAATSCFASALVCAIQPRQTVWFQNLLNSYRARHK
jgi:hypothetical protein